MAIKSILVSGPSMEIELRELVGVSVPAGIPSLKISLNGVGNELIALVSGAAVLAFTLLAAMAVNPFQRR